MEKTWHILLSHQIIVMTSNFVIKINKDATPSKIECTSSSIFLVFDFEHSLFLCNTGECVISIDTFLSSQYLNLSYQLLLKIAKFNQYFLVLQRRI